MTSLAVFPPTPATRAIRPSAARPRENAEWLAGLRPGARHPELIAELRAYLRGVVRKALGSHTLRQLDLDDVEQDTMVRILSRLDDFRGESRFTTWASAIAIRVARSAMRRRRPTALDGPDLERALHDRDGSRAAQQDPARLATVSDLRAALDCAIARTLTDRQRSVILGQLSGTPSAELVTRLGTNRNALHKLFHDARRKLKHAINAAGFSDSDVRDLALARVA